MSSALNKKITVLESPYRAHTDYLVNPWNMGSQHHADC